MKDWNINDNKDSGYIQNRTHWKEVGQPLIAVGTPECGVSDLYTGPIVKFVFVPASQGVKVSLDDNTSVPIYTDTIIETMWSAVDKATGKRSLLSYNPVEVFEDYYLSFCIQFLGGATKSTGDKRVAFAKVTDTCNPDTISSIKNSIIGFIDRTRIGMFFNGSERDEDNVVFSNIVATEEQVRAMQEYVNTVGYNIAGGTLAGLISNGSSDSFNNISEFHIVNPNDRWNYAWGVDSYNYGFVPEFVLQRQKPDEHGLEYFYLVPQYRYSNKIYGEEEIANTDWGYSVQLGELGINQLGRYTPVTYHTIPAEYLPQDLQDMYSWYQKNYDKIQSTISSGSSSGSGPLE